MSARVTARAGLLDVLDRPLAILLELLWRWLFGSLALISTAVACVYAFSSTNISDVDQHAIFLSGDPQRALDSLLRILLVLGPKFLRQCVWLVPLCSLLYWLLSTFGRALTLVALSAPRKSHARDLRWRVYLKPSAILQALRVLAFYAAIALAFSAILLASRVSPPDFADFTTVYRYYALLLPLWLLIALLWSLLNLALSLAPATLLRAPTPPPPLRTLLRLWNSDWLRVVAQFATFKGLAIVLALSASFIIAGWSVLLSWYLGSAMLLLISLLYFGVADVLFLARLAALSRINPTLAYVHEVQLRDL